MGRLALPLVAAFLALVYGALQSEPALAPQAVHDAVLLALVLALTVLVVQTVTRLVVEWAEWRLDGQRPTHLLRFLLGLVLYGAAAVVISRTLVGVDLVSIAMASAATALVVGLAVQATLGNVVAGMAMRLERPTPMRLGDVLRIGGAAGALERITWRSIAIRTERGSTLVIPNDRLAADSVEVFAGDRPMERSVHVKLPAAARPRVVTDVVTSVVRQLPGVDPRVPPRVLCGETEYAGDVASLRTYEIAYATASFDAGRFTDAILHERLWYALSRAGIAGGHGAGAVEAGWRAAARRALTAAPALAAVDPQGRERLVAEARCLLFATGERLASALGPGTSLYVITAGRAAVPAAPPASADDTAPAPTGGPDATADLLATDASGGRLLNRQRIAARLAEHVGPIAHRLVAEASTRHDDPVAIYRAVAEEIDDAHARRAFLAAAPAAPSLRLQAGELFGLAGWLTGIAGPAPELEAEDEVVLVEIPHARLGELTERDPGCIARLARAALAARDGDAASERQRDALGRLAREALVRAE